MHKKPFDETKNNYKMKKISITIIAIFFAASFLTAQEEEKEKKKATFATQNYDITIYSIFWTNTSFGNLESGSDLLLETGVGLGFKLFDNKLYLNPSLGISHGKFSSNSNATKIGEGLVPNIYVNYHDRLFDFEGYLAYYKSIREDDDIVTKDFLLHWMAPGINVGSRVVLGAYYESFGITRQEDGDPLLIYQWLGGSVKLKFDKGISFRFSAGATLNTDAGTSDEFYKVAAFIPL